MTQQSTMRDLLARWAAAEPERCRVKEQAKGFTIHSSGWDFILLENLATEESQMQIQWAVQQAITARGWWFSAYYTPESGYTVEVMFPSIYRRREHSDNNIAEAFLGAYLQALEANKGAS